MHAMSVPAVNIANLEVDTVEVRNVVVRVDGHNVWAMAWALAALLCLNAALQLVLLALHIRREKREARGSTAGAQALLHE